MSSVVEICNVAIIELGALPIAALTETSTQAVACNAVFDQSRRSALRSHPWNFSMKTVELAQLLTNTRTFRYDNAYQLPSDLLLLRRTYDVDRLISDLDFKVESDILYTNAENIKILYVYDNQDTETWDALFTDAMSAKIQSKIAYAITRERANAVQAEAYYQARLLLAQVADASEDISDSFITENSEFTGVRY